MTPDPIFVVFILVSVFVSIAIHEFAHAKVADMAGDFTPRVMGRVTLNPLAHFDAMGAVMIVITSLSGFGIGWGKPVMVNPSRMGNPRWDHFWSVAAGPLSNFLQAAAAAIVLRLVTLGGIDEANYLSIFLRIYIVVNISLMLFNLIPLGPLDGHWLVGAFLPEPTRTRWYQFNRGPGTVILLVFIVLGQVGSTGVISMVIQPIARRILEFLI